MGAAGEGALDVVRFGISLDGIKKMVQNDSRRISVHWIHLK